MGPIGIVGWAGGIDIGPAGACPMGMVPAPIGGMLALVAAGMGAGMGIGIAGPGKSP